MFANFCQFFFFYNLDNFDNVWLFGQIGDLWHLRHWFQLRTWTHDNFCYLTIKSDTGQYLQFLRCLFCGIFPNCIILNCIFRSIPGLRIYQASRTCDLLVCVWSWKFKLSDILVIHLCFLNLNSFPQKLQGRETPLRWWASMCYCYSWSFFSTQFANLSSFFSIWKQVFTSVHHWFHLLVKLLQVSWYKIWNFYSLLIFHPCVYFGLKIIQVWCLHLMKRFTIHFLRGWICI